MISTGSDKPVHVIKGICVSVKELLIYNFTSCVDLTFFIEPKERFQCTVVGGIIVRGGIIIISIFCLHF